MKNKKLVTIFVVLAVLFTFGATPVLAKTIKWKVQSLFGSGELTYKTFVDFCKNVKKMTNGRLVMEPLSAGTIVPTFEMLEAVQDNVLQAMYTGAAYYSGKEPAMAFFSDLIFAYDAPVFHPFIFAAVTFIVFGGPENLSTEKALPFWFECSVIDCFRLFYLTMRPLQNLLW